MNARELVFDLRLLGPQDQNVIFAFIANRVYQLRLNSGGRINDLMDFKLFLHELSEAWRFADFQEGVVSPPSVNLLTMPECRPASPGKVAKVARMPQHDVYDVCLRCGHVHEGIGECGVPIGAGRFCRCEIEVSA